MYVKYIFHVFKYLCTTFKDSYIYYTLNIINYGIKNN